MKIFEYFRTLLDPKFLTEEQIIRDLISCISEIEKDEIVNTPFDKLIKFHSGGGRYIRNKYHLWHERNPYTKYDQNNPADPRHPDNMSMRIIEKVWKRLTAVPPNILKA